MKRLLLVLLILAAAAFAQVTPSGRFVRQHPPSGTDGVAGAGGPLPNEALTTLRTGLLSYYTMDEGSGATRVDSHGSNDLSDVNTVGSVAGILGNAASFPATGRLEAAYNAAYQPGITGTGASWSMWLNRTTVPTAVVGVNGESVADNGLGCQVPSTAFGANQGKPFCTGKDANSTVLNPGYGSSTSICTGAWFHVAVTFNPTDRILRVYQNGSLRASSSAGTSSSLLNAAGTLYFGLGKGAQPYGSSGGTALMDEVATYNKALTLTEVQCLYGNGTPPAYPFTGVCLGS